MSKREALLELARRRQSDMLPPHQAISAFHGGAYDCDHVSPWTKGASNVDTYYMLVAQDWASSDFLAGPLQPELVELGQAPRLPTNRNITRLLRDHLGVRFSDTYATNLFVFAKSGGMNARIPWRHLAYSAETYALPEIEIVAPKVAICLGSSTFNALRKACGLRPISTVDAMVHSPFHIGEVVVTGVAHPGALGMANRGKANVDADWNRLRAQFGA